MVPVKKMFFSERLETLNVLLSKEIEHIASEELSKIQKIKKGYGELNSKFLYKKIDVWATYNKL